MTQIALNVTPDEIKTLGYQKVENRKTDELIFAFVEPMSGGAKKALTNLKEILESPPFSYKINEILTRDILEDEKKNKNIQECDYPPGDILKHENAKSIYRLQQWGNILRRRFGNDYLAKQIIRKIAKYRQSYGYEAASSTAVSVPKPLRVAHLVRSLKHEAELQLLKTVYGNMLFVLAVSTDYENRFKNYFPAQSPEQEKKDMRREFDYLSSIDQDDGNEYGQRVRKVFYQADIFLNGSIELEKELRRFINILFDQYIYVPRHDECMMHSAFTASMMSTCLSRQVGAAISNENHELLSIGWNDIPRYGGGLASEEGDDLEREALCKTKGKCNSNKKIKELVSNIYEKLHDNAIIKRVSKEKFSSILFETSLTNLIEFSRSIHAEMEAILSVAREGKSGLRGASLYVTTYPCENCVKHILACGISRVFYIEPYPKSRAHEFFGEFVYNDSKDSKELKGKKLELIQYVGVSPRSFLFLYKTRERKDKDGNLIHRNNAPWPKTNVFLDGFTIYEAKIASEVIDNERK